MKHIMVVENIITEIERYQEYEGNQKYEGRNYQHRNKSNFSPRRERYEHNYEKIKPRKLRGRNPLDTYGKITRCNICDSINHWENECPDKLYETKQTYHENCVDSSDHESDEESITYSVCINSDEGIDLPKTRYSCQSYNVAILDSAAPKSVCGTEWLKQYIDTLGPEDKSKVKYSTATNVYKFGCSEETQALHKVRFPALLGDIEVILKADVVKGELPLLLGRSCMKKANTELNFKEDTIQILGQVLNLLVTRSGHYALPLGKNKQLQFKRPQPKLLGFSQAVHFKEFIPNESGEIDCENDCTSISQTGSPINSISYYTTIKNIGHTFRIKNSENEIIANITDESDVEGDENKTSNFREILNKIDYKVKSETNGLSNSSNCDSSEESDSSLVSDSSSNTTSSCTDDNDSSSWISDTSSNCSEDVIEELAPIFANDGIVGNVNSPDIITKVFPAESLDNIIALINKEFKSLKRDVWLSVANFDVVNLPDSLDVIMRNNFRKKATSMFRKSLDQFNAQIKSNGGRLFLMEIFPSPCILDPDRSTLSKMHQNLGWEMFLNFNQVIKEFNTMNGVQKTLNVNSYLRAKIKLNKSGRRKGVKRTCLEVSSNENAGGKRSTRWESKVNKDLHQADNMHLLEPTRLVISDVVLRAIKEKKRV